MALQNASLVSVASQILNKATTLQDQLDQASLPQPSLDSDVPFEYPFPQDHPDAYNTRLQLVDLSSALLGLARGPVEHLRFIIGADRYRSIVLRVIDHCDIVSLVSENNIISYADLAQRLNVDQNLLERVLHFACNFGFFRESPAGHIRHTALSQALPAVAPFLRFQTGDYVNNADRAVLAALETSNFNDPKPPPIPFHLADGSNRGLFGALEAAPPDTYGMSEFSAAMITLSLMGSANSQYFIKGFPWDTLPVNALVADIGGGNGHITVSLARAYPHLRFVVQDLASNKGPADGVIPPGLKPRVRFVAHDFFTPQPSGDQGADADVFFMKSILHDWSDVGCARILEQLLPQFWKGKRLWNVDRMMPRPGEGSRHAEAHVRNMDLLMWELLGAKERNLEEWERVLGMVEGAEGKLKVLAWRQPTGCEWAMLEIGMEV